MTAEVPTKAEFDALAARVAALEQGQSPPEPPSGSGEPARRVADLIETFGVNTFSSMDENNVWGSWPADYRPASVLAALRYMTEGTGFAFRLREYHYAGRVDMQRAWLREIVAAIPATQVTLCVGANGSPDDVPTMCSLADDPGCGVVWIEGLNEPNTDFGSGQVPVASTKAIQDAVWSERTGDVTILGPSIVAGTPHPEGWITGYCGDDLDAICAAMTYGNGHYYPPANPGIYGTGYSVDEYVIGLATAYGHSIQLTEFHPTLYSSEGNNPGQPGWSGERDAYFTLLTLLRCAGNPSVGLWWYALFDYGSTYTCGLFPKSGQDEPRPAATALRNLCQICADPSPLNRTFSPGALDLSVAGLPEEDAWDLYQASDGRFLLALWRAADPDAEAVRVEIALDKSRQFLVFDPLASADPITGPGHAAVISLELSAGVRIVEIAP